MFVLCVFQPKVARKVHSFKSMPSVQRRVIHELAESYGCQTESYDEEPNKNVVATAVRYFCTSSFTFTLPYESFFVVQQEGTWFDKNLQQQFL